MSFALETTADMYYVSFCTRLMSTNIDHLWIFMFGLHSRAKALSLSTTYARAITGYVLLGRRNERSIPFPLSIHHHHHHHHPLPKK